MKKIGLVGGLSYVSTLEYYRLINAMVRQELGGHSSARLVIESLDEREFLDKQKEILLPSGGYKKVLFFLAKPKKMLLPRCG